MLAVSLSYMAFIMLRSVPSIPNLLRVFFFFLIMKGYTLSNDFSASIEMKWCSSFILLMYYIYWSAYFQS